MEWSPLKLKPVASPDPAKSMAGKIGAHTKWARTTDRTQATQAARDEFEARFLAEAGGDPIRAKHLRKLYYARLSLKSAKTRAARKAGKTSEADAAETQKLDALGGGPLDAA